MSGMMLVSGVYEYHETHVEGVQSSHNNQFSHIYYLADFQFPDLAPHLVASWYVVLTINVRRMEEDEPTLDLTCAQHSQDLAVPPSNSRRDLLK